MTHMIDTMYKAEAMAKERHEGQKYGEHDYFEHHICGVTKLIGDVHFKSILSMNIIYDALIVGNLHDILEDTDTEWEELYNEFGMKLANYVQLLTKKKGELYDEYLTHVLEKGSITTWLVKYCDLTFNIESSRKRYEEDKKYKHMLEKYLLAKMLIEEKMLIVFRNK